MISKFFRNVDKFMQSGVFALVFFFAPVVVLAITTVVVVIAASYGVSL